MMRLVLATGLTAMLCACAPMLDRDETMAAIVEAAKTKGPMTEAQIVRVFAIPDASERHQGHGGPGDYSYIWPQAAAMHGVWVDGNPPYMFLRHQYFQTIRVVFTDGTCLPREHLAKALAVQPVDDIQTVMVHPMKGGHYFDGRVVGVKFVVDSYDSYKSEVVIDPHASCSREVRIRKLWDLELWGSAR